MGWGQMLERHNTVWGGRGERRGAEVDTLSQRFLDARPSPGFRVKGLCNTEARTHEVLPTRDTWPLSPV